MFHHGRVFEFGVASTFTRVDRSTWTECSVSACESVAEMIGGLHGVWSGHETTER
jgi:hypothetical protein